MAAPTETIHAEGDGEQDADALLASLEEEDDSAYREQRIQQLSGQAQQVQRRTLATARSLAYVTLKSDDEALRFTTEHERAVVHFFHPEFARCSTMDEHCEHIASRYQEHGTGDVAFARIDVKNAAFVVQKLGIRVLPCVIGFVHGVVAGRVTGFEGISWSGGDEASRLVTVALEARLVEWAVLKKKFLEDVGDLDDLDDLDHQHFTRNTGSTASSRAIRDQLPRRSGSGRNGQDDDDDWD